MKCSLFEFSSLKIENNIFRFAIPNRREKIYYQIETEVVHIFRLERLYIFSLKNEMTVDDGGVFLFDTRIHSMHTRRERIRKKSYTFNTRDDECVWRLFVSTTYTPDDFRFSLDLLYSAFIRATHFAVLNVSTFQFFRFKWSRCVVRVQCLCLCECVCVCFYFSLSRRSRPYVNVVKRLIDHSQIVMVRVMCDF